MLPALGVVFAFRGNRLKLIALKGQVWNQVKSQASIVATVIDANIDLGRRTGQLTVMAPHMASATFAVGDIRPVAWET